MSGSRSSEGWVRIVSRGSSSRLLSRWCQGSAQRTAISGVCGIHSDPNRSAAPQRTSRNYLYPAINHPSSPNRPRGEPIRRPHITCAPKIRRGPSLGVGMRECEGAGSMRRAGGAADGAGVCKGSRGVWGYGGRPSVGRPPPFATTV